MEFRICKNLKEIKNLLDKDLKNKFLKYIYILELSDNTTKIGISSNPIERYYYLRWTYKKENIQVKRIALSTPRENAEYIEDIFHFAFDQWLNDKVNFETYNLSFDDMLTVFLPAVEKFMDELYSVKFD